MQVHSDTLADAPRRRKERDPDWRKELPRDWRSFAIAPLSFATHRDYEMPASRTLGYDEEMQPCFYRHTYMLGALYSDDDEEYYADIAYGEEVCAWRLRDERWLIWRMVHEDGGGRASRGFYSFSENMPR